MKAHLVFLLLLPLTVGAQLCVDQPEGAAASYYRSQDAVVIWNISTRNVAQIVREVLHEYAHNLFETVLDQGEQMQYSGVYSSSNQYTTSYAANCRSYFDYCRTWEEDFAETYAYSFIISYTENQQYDDRKAFFRQHVAPFIGNDGGKK